MKEKTIQLDKSTRVLNLALMAGVLLLVMYYVIEANIIAAGNYKIKLLNDRILSLQEANTNLLAQRANTEDTAGLIAFAQSQNMVQARDVIYLFSNGNVALK